VKLVLDEPDAETLRTYFEWAQTPLTSAIALVEVPRAVRRVEPAAATFASEQLEGLGIIELDDDILEGAARLDPVDLRTLDAIHLASALKLGPDLASLVTYDRRLHQAAARMGVSVTSLERRDETPPKAP
jgi:predicted nucleic acid-binding protein